MVTDIEIGKNYALYLLPLYGGYKQNLAIIGKTNIDNVALNEDEYNIYETYFQPLGLGLTSYYTAIQEKTEIYICRPITSLEPFAIGDEKVFVPLSLIDLKETSEYVSAYNFNFHIYPVIKRFDSDSARDDFNVEIKNKMLNKLKELIEFNILDETAIDVSYDTVYLTKETAESLEGRSRKLWDQYNNYIRTFRNNERIKEDQYNALVNEMRKSIDENNKAKKAYDDATALLEIEKNRYTEAIAALNNP